MIISGVIKNKIYRITHDCQYKCLKQCQECLARTGITTKTHLTTAVVQDD